MKKITILILFCCLLLTGISINLKAQIYYKYDNAGNRTSRSITLTKSAKMDSAQLAEFNKQPQEKFEDVLGEQKITIYPNPTHGDLSIAVDNLPANTTGHVSVFDLNGRSILTQAITSSSTAVNLLNAPSGTYILRIQIGDKQTSWKVIKE